MWIGSNHTRPCYGVFLSSLNGQFLGEMPGLLQEEGVKGTEETDILNILPKLEKWYFPAAEDDMAEGETRGDWLPVSCSPPVEWERSHSLPSSWLACRDDGGYLQNSTAKTSQHTCRARRHRHKHATERRSRLRLNNTLRLTLITMAQFFQRT